MSFWQAQRCFEDALRYIDPVEDPVMWDVCQGLAALAEGLAELANMAEQMPSVLQRLQRMETLLNGVLRKIQSL